MKFVVGISLSWAVLLFGGEALAIDPCALGSGCNDTARGSFSWSSSRPDQPRLGAPHKDSQEEPPYRERLMVVRRVTSLAREVNKPGKIVIAQRLLDSLRDNCQRPETPFAECAGEAKKIEDLLTPKQVTDGSHPSSITISGGPANPDMLNQLMGRPKASP